MHTNFGAEARSAFFCRDAERRCPCAVKITAIPRQHNNRATPFRVCLTGLKSTADLHDQHSFKVQNKKFVFWRNCYLIRKIALQKRGKIVSFVIKAVCILPL